MLLTMGYLLIDQSLDVNEAANTKVVARSQAVVA